MEAFAEQARSMYAATPTMVATLVARMAPREPADASTSGLVLFPSVALQSLRCDHLFNYPNNFK